MNGKFWSKIKRFLLGLIAVAIALTMLPVIPTVADDAVDKYPYTLFATYIW